MIPERIPGVVLRLTMAGGVDSDMALLMLGCAVCVGESGVLGPAPYVLPCFGLVLTTLFREGVCILEPRARSVKNELSGLESLRLRSGLCADGLDAACSGASRCCERCAIWLGGGGGLRADRGGEVRGGKSLFSLGDESLCLRELFPARVPRCLSW